MGVVRNKGTTQIETDVFIVLLWGARHLRTATNLRLLPPTAETTLTSGQACLNNVHCLTGPERQALTTTHPLIEHKRHINRALKWLSPFSWTPTLSLMVTAIKILNTFLVFVPTKTCYKKTAHRLAQTPRLLGSQGHGNSTTTLSRLFS